MAVINFRATNNIPDSALALLSCLETNGEQPSCNITCEVQKLSRPSPKDANSLVSDSVPVPSKPPTGCPFWLEDAIRHFPHLTFVLSQSKVTLFGLSMGKPIILDHTKLEVQPSARETAKMTV